jgi:CheY-like chemotaxis protein
MRSPGQHHDVLVVEDDADIRQLLRGVFEDEGLGVATAAHGREALEVLARARVGLVVTDLMMPVMDGQQLVETMRATEALARIPVLIVTAGRNLSELPRGEPVFFKPLRLDGIVDVVKGLLELRRTTAT